MGQYVQPRAGPFRADNSKRPGLDTGDVVCFLNSEGQPYAVREVPHESHPGQKYLVLEPSESASAKDRACHLEVLRQGKWIGFRSLSGGNRFLQARRRSVQRLCFFNTNFGTWEQWEFAHGEPRIPWDRMTMYLKSRRLPQYVLSVEVVRVGAYEGGSPFLTPRSLRIPGQDDQGTVMSSMSGLLIHEWFQFVNKEKGARLETDKAVAALLQEAADMKSSLLAQIEHLRSEAKHEIHKLAGQELNKERIIADRERRLSANMLWGVNMLHSKNMAIILRQALGWWSKMTRYRVRTSNLVEKCLLRCRSIHLNAAFNTWVDFVWQLRDLQRRMKKVLARISNLKVSAAWNSWQQFVSMSIMARQTMCQMHLRYLATLQYKAMERWALYVQDIIANKAKIRMALNHMRMLLTGYAMRGWRAATRDAVETKHRMRKLMRRFMFMRLHAAMNGWYDQMIDRRRLRAKARAVALKVANRTAWAAFNTWSENVYEIRRHRDLMAKVLHRLANRILSRCWVSWVLAVDAKRDLDARLRGIANRIAQSGLAAAFNSWTYNAGGLAFSRRRAAHIVRMMTNRKLSIAFNTWAEMLLDRRRHEFVLQRCVQRMRQRGLSTAFTTWWEDVQEVRPPAFPGAMTGQETPFFPRKCKPAPILSDSITYAFPRRGLPTDVS